MTKKHFEMSIHNKSAMSHNPQSKEYKIPDSRNLVSISMQYILIYDQELFIVIRGLVSK